MTNLDDSIDSSNFSVTDYLHLIRKNSVIHIHGLAVYVKEGLLLARNISLEYSEGYLFSSGIYCLRISCSFGVLLVFNLSINIFFAESF